MFINSMDGYSEWQCSVETVQKNRLPYTNGFFPYASIEEALNPPDECEFMIFRNGEWLFKLYHGDSCPADFHDNIFSRADWKRVILPHTYGSELKKPSDDRYPWEDEKDILPPCAPKKINSVGCYVRTVKLENLLHTYRYILRFDGVAGAFYLFVNGERVGFSKNSFCTAEFDVTDFLCCGENTIAVEVHTFSTGSWLESEEAWALPGIFRDVTFYKIPENHITDFTVHARPDSDYKDGNLIINAEVTDNAEGLILDLTVFDERNTVVALDRCFVKSSGEATLKTTIASVKLWSDETPSLYKIVLCLKNDYSTIHYAAADVGFRSIEINNSALKINGKNVILKGVNLKENNGGHAYTKDELERAVIQMKRANVNAVRTWRHPFGKTLYSICDKYGIYVINENSISAEPTKNASSQNRTTLPGSRGEWTAVCRDRTASLYQRDKNSACVIGWSVGDLSCGGNSVLMREYLEEKDSSRLLYIENDSFLSLPSSKMLVFDCKPKNAVQLEGCINSHLSRSFLLSSFARCEGNSCGSLSEYMRLFRECKNLYGGFLSFWNDIMNEDIICTPIFSEIRALFSPIEFSPVYPNRGIFDVINHSNFTDLSELTLCWQGFNAVKSTGQGFVVIAAPAASTVRVELPLGKQAQDECYLTLRALSGESKPWRKKGEAVANTQFVINRHQYTPKPLSNGITPEIDENYRSLIIECEDFELTFDKRSGLLSAFSFRGNSVLASPIIPNFWRLPTQADIDEKINISSAVWEKAGESCTGVITNAYINSDKNCAVVETQLCVPTYPKSDVKITYKIFPAGITVNAVFSIAENLPPLPAVGLCFYPDSSFTSFEYLGKGPEENYCDRGSGASTGIYTQTVNDISSPYAVMQEYGNHCNVRYCELCTSNCILRIEGMPEYELNIMPEFSFLPQQQKQAQVFIRAKQNGVSDCKASVPTQIIPSGCNYALNFTLIPLANE